MGRCRIVLSFQPSGPAISGLGTSFDTGGRRTAPALTAVWKVSEEAVPWSSSQRSEWIVGDPYSGAAGFGDGILRVARYQAGIGCHKPTFVTNVARAARSLDQTNVRVADNTQIEPL
jgi:hypothetical protein